MSSTDNIATDPADIAQNASIEQMSSPVCEDNNADLYPPTPAEDAQMLFGKEEKTGEYLTPYKRTIIYDDSDLFESIVASMSTRAQRIPLIKSADLDNIAASITFITPDLVLMKEFFSAEQLQKFTARGFKLVLIFDPAKRFTDITDFIETSTPRPIKFGLDMVYDTLELDSSLACSLMLERVTSHKFPDYISPSGQKFDKDECQALISGIISTGRPVQDIVTEMCSSWQAFKMLDELTMRGRVLGDFKKQIAQDRVSSFGIETHIDLDGKSYAAYVIYSVEFVPEVRDALAATLLRHESAFDFGIIYRFEQKVDFATKGEAKKSTEAAVQFLSARPFADSSEIVIGSHVMHQKISHVSASEIIKMMVCMRSV